MLMHPINIQNSSMMKTTLFTLLLLILSAFSLSAQEKVKFGDAIGAKILFVDHGNPNSVDSLDITNGLEISYIKGINRFLNFALPVKVSIADVAGDINNRNIVSVDALLHFQYFKPQSRIIPYALLGGGMAFEQTLGSYWQVPLGLGLNVRVGDNSFVNVQGEYRYTTEEYRKNLQLGAGIVYRFSKRDIDRDKDGIVNEEDACPDIFGPAATMGCPDQDGDGVADKDDNCPLVAGLIDFQGCPDTDGDGIVDSRDACPEEAGTEAARGCPDRDGDGVADSSDNCPDEPGTLKGCPDRDGDRVADKDDECPDTFGLLSNNGCPAELGEEPEDDKDTDGDGVMDSEDNCPDEVGTAAAGGCPDTDSDGVPDKDDRCPNKPGIYSGCPDSDGDGVMDADDQCPMKVGPASNYGCPPGTPTKPALIDTDGDGVLDAEDDCPDEAGPADNNGCPQAEAPAEPETEAEPAVADRDGDGITDRKDMCPDEFGPALTDGCPDRDGDGVADKDDRCPDTPGKYTGCPDTDGDGLMDADDRCPNKPGLIQNGGCPEVEKEIRDVLEFAMQAVQFETGKATLKAVSYEVLDEIAGIMKKYPAYKLRINGHTDNVGSSVNNKILSEERAQSCYEYLIAAGVEVERVSYAGFGETKPISTNNTPEGRSLNRRVEFEVYVD
jgi:outer membrane protein OmpA-like peptidoglycan-associated protein